jgi:uncharacterized protein
VSAEFFVDTSAWYPLLSSTHPDHEPLAGALRALIADRRRLVTTNLIVAETHALLIRRAGSRAALGFAATVAQAPNLVVRSSEALEQVAINDWLERFTDQDFSFADAVSFAVMAERGIEEALTLDHHFEVAGFRSASAGLTHPRRRK